MDLLKRKQRSEEAYYMASQWTLMKNKLLEHHLAKFSMTILAILYLTALFAPFVAPYGLEDYDSNYKNAKPSEIHLIHEGKFIGPYIYKQSYSMNKETFKREWHEDRTTPYPIKLFVKGNEYKLLGLFESDLHLFGIEVVNDKNAPRLMLFGSDNLGNDLFSRVVLGSRVSLTIPFVGTAISFFLGIIIGGISGYFGGVVDNVIQRFIEVLSSLPTIPLWMALSASIPPNVPVAKMYLYITIIISLLSWTGLARIVRGNFFSMKNEDYVIAAKLAGVNNFKVITRHMVPGFMSYLIVSLTLGIPGMIIGETSMSFLGLGMRAPATSWGVLLKETQDITSVAQYPWRLIPLVAVIITVLAFNFLGDGLRDAADPYK